MGFWKSWWEDVSVWHWIAGLALVLGLGTDPRVAGNMIGAIFWITIIYVIVYYWNKHFKKK